MAVGQWADLKNYVLECSQLLYQIFFQPYTLRRRLRDIHPSLDINSNPFLLRNELLITLIWNVMPSRHGG